MLDIEALLVFIKSVDGFVDTWYDQTGSKDDVVPPDDEGASS